MSKNNLCDQASERLLLSSLVKNGPNAFIDINAIVSAEDFNLGINKLIFKCISGLYEDGFNSFDPESILLKGRNLGFDKYFDKQENIEYIELLEHGSSSKDNVELFAYQIKKWSVLRKLHNRYKDAAKYIEEVEKDEKLSTILGHAEEKIVDFINDVDDGEVIGSLSENIKSCVQDVINSEVIDQVGIPTGFQQYDQAIGGGLRRGGINIIASRAKCGKSFMALNMALNMSKLNIPVLYLDTELTQEYQQSRLVSIESGCPLYLYETRRFREDKNLLESVKMAGESLSKLKIQYRSIAGLSYQEALAVVRRWLVKYVGFNENGQAKDCVIVYDYLKMTGHEKIGSSTPEWILLGLMITEMQNFCVKYGVPMLAFSQLNREGISSDSTGSIAGSDRLLWLCSSMSILRNKTEEDVEMQCGWDFGNKKLLVLEARYGPGLFHDDYINLVASLKPNRSEYEACGKITEGLTYYDCIKSTTNTASRTDS
ncbi:MAG: hypothetical protein BAJALOKI3v1_50095 [Promethearchaeota archaeon]|nr:MAG: hypothetical protein BAJALOKI3v1_50095 [Candidatus Lokiarchaeota archaeon]